MHVNISLLNTNLSALTLALLFVLFMAGSSLAQDVSPRQDHLIKNNGQQTLNTVEHGADEGRWAIAFSAHKGGDAGSFSIAGNGGPGDHNDLPDDVTTNSDSTGTNTGTGSGGGSSNGGDDDYERFGQDHDALGIDGTARQPRSAGVVSNYPNPFNPETTIRFEVKAAQQVQLAVYNALGQRVRVLVYGWVEAGAHEARFDAYGLPSGTYFSRLISETGVVTRTMVLAR